MFEVSRSSTSFAANDNPLLPFLYPLWSKDSSKMASEVSDSSLLFRIRSALRTSPKADLRLLPSRLPTSSSSDRFLSSPRLPLGNPSPHFHFRTRPFYPGFPLSSLVFGLEGYQPRLARDCRNGDVQSTRSSALQRPSPFSFFPLPCLLSDIIRMAYLPMRVAQSIELFTSSSSLSRKKKTLARMVVIKSRFHYNICVKPRAQQTRLLRRWSFPAPQR